MQIGRVFMGCVWAAVTLANQSVAEIYTAGPTDNWFQYLSPHRLQPGDELVLQAGVYTDSRRLVLNCRGSHDKPIHIRAAAGQRVVFHRPDAKQNTMRQETVPDTRYIFDTRYLFGFADTSR